jgi:hypothetical protein
MLPYWCVLEVCQKHARPNLLVCVLQGDYFQSVVFISLYLLSPVFTVYPISEANLECMMSADLVRAFLALRQVSSTRKTSPSGCKFRNWKSRAYPPWHPIIIGLLTNLNHQQLLFFKQAQVCILSPLSLPFLLLLVQPRHRNLFVLLEAFLFSPLLDTSLVRWSLIR